MPKPSKTSKSAARQSPLSAKRNDKSLPSPTVVIPVGAGRVEISVEDGRIWLSDYSSNSKRNYTMVIPRRKLRRQADACRQVHALLAQQAQPEGAVGGSRPQPVPPRTAGYWYETDELPLHGRPVILID